jgi:excisionase family DNA binding protein
MPFQFHPVIPTPDEQRLARAAVIQLCGVTECLGLQVVCQGNTKLVSLPAPALELLRLILDEMAEGAELAVVPVVQELSVPEAAKLMKVSRQFLANSIDEGSVPGRRIGKHRRVQLRYVLSWMELLQKREWWLQNFGR